MKRTNLSLNGGKDDLKHDLFRIFMIDKLLTLGYKVTRKENTRTLETTTLTKEEKKELVKEKELLMTSVITSTVLNK